MFTRRGHKGSCEKNSQVKCTDAKVLTLSISNKDKHKIILYKDPKD